METKSGSGKQATNRNKLLIIIAAVVVVLLLLVLGALLLFGGGEQPAPSGPTEGTTESSGTTESTPPPAVNMPAKVWDMEGLPANLIDAGMAYANSSNAIYGNLVIGGVDGKGLGGSTAFGYTFVGAKDSNDIYVMSPISLKGQNLVTDWSKGEMLWFWVNGTELLQNVRLYVTVNGKFLPIGSTYYTIDSEGKCVPVGTIPEAFGTTTTKGAIRLDQGWEGWIGLPIEETYGEIKTLTSIQIEVGNSTIKAGNILYIDEFWLTELYEVPPLSVEELNYSAMESLLASLTHGKIWDVELPEAGTEVGTVAATAGRNNATSKIFANKGVMGSKAWGYILDQVENTNSQNVTMSAIALAKYGVETRAIKSESDILWFWVNSDLSAGVMMHLQLNGVFQARKGIYTITVQNGQPVITTVGSYDSKGSVNGVSVVPNNGNPTGVYGRIEVSAGWSGWVGIPVGNFCVNSDGTPAEVPTGKTGSLTLRLYAPANSFQVGETLYFDEFWITEAGKMPDLSSDALCYGYTASAEKPTFGYGQIWDGGDGNKVAAGTQIGSVGSSADRNVVTAPVVDGKGVGGSKGMSYVLGSVDKTNGNNLTLISGDLSEFGYKIANVGGLDDILWLWVDSLQDADQLLHLQVNSVQTHLKQAPIYSIAPDADGNAVIVEVPFYDAASSCVSGVGVVPQGDYARIKLCDGWSGWIGIPVGHFSVNSTGEPSDNPMEKISSITIRNFASANTLTAGDAIVFDEFWLTEKETMPALTDEELLWGYTAPSDSDDEPEGPHQTPLQNFDALTAGSSFGSMSNSNAILTSTIIGDRGIAYSNALALIHSSGTSGNSNNLKMSAGTHFAEGKILATDDVLWFWVDSDMDVDRLIHVQLNDSHLAIEKDLLTIIDNEGTAQIDTIKWYGLITDVPAGEAGVCYSGGNSTDKYGRVMIRAGWSGWIGIPVDSFCGNNTTAPVAGATVDTILIRLYKHSSMGSWVKGQTLYIDELWLTSSGLMPDLTNEELLYTYTPPVVTEINLSNRYQDGMIFQQNKPWIVNGTGVIGETVTVELIDKENATVQTKTATVDSESNWTVTMDDVAGSYDAYTVKVSSGNNTKTVQNIVFGEVWAAGGQSNMAYTVYRDPSGDTVLTEADMNALQAELAAYENASYIRFFMSSGAHQNGLVNEDVVGSWGNCSDWDAVKACSATALYFAKNLEAVLEVPVGVVVGAVGGTNLSAWVDPTIAQADTDFYNAVNTLGYVGSSAEQRAMLGGWFNARVAAWVGFEVNGFIWYQGEQDSGKTDPQKLGYDVLVDSWSKVFNSEDTVDALPLVAMQVAPYAGSVTGASYAKVNETNELNVAMLEGVSALTSKATCVQIYDLFVDITNHHPQHKPDLGARASVAALNMVYGKGSVWSGPTLESADYSIAGQITLTFANVGTGLQYTQLTAEKNGRTENSDNIELPTDMYVDAVNGFSVWTGTEYIDITSASFVGHNKIVLALPDGVEAAGVCYGRGMDILTANIYNKEGFPAVPFEHVRPGFTITHKTPLWNADSNEAAVLKDNNASNNRNTSKISIGAFGIGGSNALRYELVTTGHDRTHTWNWSNPGDYGFRTDISLTADDDIIWFWLDANVSTVQRLQFSVNDLSIPSVAESYIYTLAGSEGNISLVKVPYGGDDPVEGMSLLKHSATQAQIQVEPGWSGWIGIPCSMYGMEKGDTISKLGILLLQKDSTDYSGQQVGDNVTFDEFWLTSAGQYPTVATAEQMAKVRYQLWDLDATDDALQDVGNANRNDRNTSSAARVSGKGLLGTNALEYKQSGLYNNGAAMTNAIRFNKVAILTTNGFDTGTAITAADDILWFWVDSDMTNDMRLQVTINGAQLKGNGSLGADGTDQSVYVYTIGQNADGKAEIQMVYLRGHETVFDASCLALVNAGATGTYSQLKFVDGWSGWVGLPVNMMTSTATLNVGDAITSMDLFMRMYQSMDGTYASQVAGEMMYFDEFWLTSAGMMPGLTDEELLWADADKVEEPEEDESDVVQIPLWNGDSMTAGTAVGTVTNNNSHNDAALTIKNDAGLLGSNALNYALTGDVLQKNQSEAYKITLADIGFATDVEIKLDQILWFWVDSNTSTAQRMHLELNGIRTKIGDCVYTIQADANGKASIVKVPYQYCDSDDDGDTDGIDGLSFVQYANNANNISRVKFSNGWAGWVGIPMEYFWKSDSAKLQDGDKLTSMTLYMYQGKSTGVDAGDQVAGDNFSLDEFWLTSANTMPGLTNAQLLNKEESSAPYLDADNATDDATSYITQTLVNQAAGDDSLTIVEGKGYNGGKAFALCNTGTGNNNYTNRWYLNFSSAEGKTALGYNTNTVLTGNEMLWFWADGTALPNGARFEIRLGVGTSFKNNLGSYYTIEVVDSQPTLTKHKLYTTSTNAYTEVNEGTRGLVHVPANFQGWIGIPIESYGTGITNIDMIEVYVRKMNNGLAAGHTVYFGDFWIGAKVGDTWAIPYIAEANYR